MAKLVLVIFCLYVLAIYVLALDQNLHWGLFPLASTRQIRVQIQQLGDASLGKDKQEALRQDLVNWNTFAIPPLLEAVEKDPPAIRDPALKVLQTIAYKYYNTDLAKYGSDPAQLRQWWRDLQASWAKPATESKP